MMMEEEGAVGPTSMGSIPPRDFYPVAKGRGRGFDRGFPESMNGVVVRIVAMSCA
jgi:hypothetical protein